MDLIFNQTAADGASQDPIRFVFWLVLMMAVLGIMTYIVYVAWQGERQMRRDEQETSNRNESKQDREVSDRRAGRQENT